MCSAGLLSAEGSLVRSLFVLPNHHRVDYRADFKCCIVPAMLCFFVLFCCCCGSKHWLCDILIVLLRQLSEAEPDRQVDSGMLKRVNPGHPLIVINWIINGLSKAILQHVWTRRGPSVSWELSQQPGHALRMLLMSEVKSMSCINALCIVNNAISGILMILQCMHMIKNEKRKSRKSGWWKRSVIL